jgi:hypothetical protein
LKLGKNHVSSVLSQIECFQRDSVDENKSSY